MKPKSNCRLATTSKSCMLTILPSAWRGGRPAFREPWDGPRRVWGEFSLPPTGRSLHGRAEEQRPRSAKMPESSLLAARESEAEILFSISKAEQPPCLTPLRSWSAGGEHHISMFSNLLCCFLSFEHVAVTCMPRGVTPPASGSILPAERRLSGGQSFLR